MEEVLKSPNSLDELFKTNDFEFINTLEKNISEVHSKITEQKNKRDKIIKLLQQSLKDSNEINNSINSEEIMEILSLIHSNIDSLYSIEVNLNKFCKDFTDLCILYFFNQKSDKTIDSIKETVNNYSAELSIYNDKIVENSTKIDEFLSNNNIDDTEIENTEETIQTSTETADSEYIDLDDDILHKDNLLLIVSDKEQKVFLPYKVSEINNYLKQYPNVYSSFEDVVEKEFILPLEYYTKNPVMTRFRETYALIRDREAKSVLEALKYSFELMLKHDLNPTIIAACKTQQQLDDYLDCLDHNDLGKFKHFKIQFNVAPLATKI